MATPIYGRDDNHISQEFNDNIYIVLIKKNNTSSSDTNEYDHKENYNSIVENTDYSNNDDILVERIVVRRTHLQCLD